MTARLSRRRFLTTSGVGAAALGSGLAAAAQKGGSDRPLPVPEKLVVLTFDDAVKSHRTFVGPLLKELGFGATFFVTHAWMPDRERFMTWRDIADLHEMGFEIGNHSWTHASFGSPRTAARLAGELALVENELKKVGVPRPVSFAYCGNAFGPEAVARLAELGYRLARRGMQPEIPYGQIAIGPAFDPQRHHPLLIPTTADAYPEWTLGHFRKVLATARPGKVLVLQFHGVPDPAHPWVNTAPERFREYMVALKEGGLRCIALRDLEPYLPTEPPADPALSLRHPQPRDGRLALPVEVDQTRADLAFWLPNMLRHHRYTPAEAAAVGGMTEAEVAKWGRGEVGEKEVAPSATPPLPLSPTSPLLPYPGGRHPRTGFLDGAIDPLRGTKASVFTPWDPASYVVVDLPEAVFSNLGLTFLAHTHVPTIWNEQNVVIENVDWTRRPDGSLEHRRTLPNGIALGASIRAEPGGAAMDLWLRNGTDRPLTGMRTQVCAMLKGAAGFTAQTNDNKRFERPVAVARHAGGRRWILLAFERAGRVWGNPPCPCLHSDPILPDCAPEETATVRGWLRFYEGDDVDAQVRLLAEKASGSEQSRQLLPRGSAGR